MCAGQKGYQSAGGRGSDNAERGFQKIRIQNDMAENRNHSAPGANYTEVVYIAVHMRGMLTPTVKHYLQSKAKVVACFL